MKSRWIEYRGGRGRRLLKEKERDGERKEAMLKPDDSHNTPRAGEFLTGLPLRDPDVTKTQGTSRDKFYRPIRETARIYLVSFSPSIYRFFIQKINCQIKIHEG